MGALEKAAGQARVARIALAGVAALLVLVAAGLLAAGWSKAADSRLVAAEGVAVEAEIVNRRIREERRRSDSGIYRTVTTHLVTVAYAPLDGPAQRVETVVTSARYAALTKGAKVMLTYARSRPEVFEFEPGDLGQQAWWFWLVGAFLMVLAIGAGLGARALRRHERALSGGTGRRA